MLWQLLIGLLAGASIRARAHALGLPLALESVYHLLKRLRHRLDIIRVLLCERQRPPDCPHPDPLHQTLEHLKTTFAQADCPVRKFQLVFQQPILG